MKVLLSGDFYFKIMEYAHNEKSTTLNDYLTLDFKCKILSHVYGKMVVYFPDQMYYNWFVLRWSDEIF